MGIDNNLMDFDLMDSKDTEEDLMAVKICDNLLLLNWDD